MTLKQILCGVFTLAVLLPATGCCGRKCNYTASSYSPPPCNSCGPATIPPPPGLVPVR